MSDEQRVFLIGGSSHAGKSTVAQLLAAQLGWHYVSTDSLARHPGRPWKTAPEQVPAHVAEHYLTLAPDALLADVLRHYEHNVMPLVEQLVLRHASDAASEQLVLEGSALLPNLVASLRANAVSAVWLTASDATFTQRIHASSGYATKTAQEQQMIDAFLARTLRYNARMVAAVQRHGLPCIAVERATSPRALADMCLAVLREASRAEAF